MNGKSVSLHFHGKSVSLHFQGKLGVRGSPVSVQGEAWCQFRGKPGVRKPGVSSGKSDFSSFLRPARREAWCQFKGSLVSIHFSGRKTELEPCTSTFEGSLVSIHFSGRKTELEPCTSTFEKRTGPTFETATYTARIRRSQRRN